MVDKENNNTCSLASERFFVIFAAMRTGSNLLQSNLNQYKDVLCLGELFNGSFVGINISGKTKGPFAGYTREDVELRDRDKMLFFDRVYAQAKDKVFGFRMFKGHGDELIDIVLQNRNCRKVILKRNELDSFISLRIAIKSKRWLSKNPDRIQDDAVRFSMARFLDYLDKHRKFYSYCESVIRETGQDCYQIKYEQLKDVQELNRLAHFIGSNHEKEQIKEKIFKQTLPDLSRKVVNYEGMIQSLKDEGLYHEYFSS